jgi:type IV pilus assembly protein PilM
MALPFLNSSTPKKRDSIIAVDLGGRTTKAVHLQKKADKYVLSGYTVMDAPIYEKSLSADMLAEHLKAVIQALDARTKLATLVIGANDSLVRYTEMPAMPLEDMRQVLKMNPKNYLQQDLPGYVFDCYITLPKSAATQLKDGKAKSPAAMQRHRVLVGGAKRQLVEDMQQAIKSAGLASDSVIPALLGPVNAFEMCFPTVFAKENVALIDLGFKNSTISILQEGDLALSRVVNIGGDRLTADLSEILSISYAEAEGIKIGMTADIQPHIEPAISTLGRELRASIDFFEHQQDKTVTQAFLSGATAGSELILQLIQAELMVECKTWNPTSFAQPALTPQQTAELDAVAPQLTVAIGAALASI